ncbi:hypothetical protein [Streptomyces sp. NPDC058735]|uniref:hypothetical protein n=1 Tax=unclassified Streptomyces TaxID=2593676 RepID=UPI00367D77E7
MIQKIVHPATDTGPAGTGLALAVAYALHPPVSRAAEVAAGPKARAARRAARAKASRRRTARG